MNCNCRFCFVGAAALVVAAGSFAFAQQDRPSKPTKPATSARAQDAPQLPPGWTEADMQACEIAGTPGEMHAWLAEAKGTWEGTCKMWMAPNTEPIVSETASTVTPIMDGRYTKVEYEGEMPGMGPFNGFGLYGYDNVSEKFQSTWIDNHSTGIMFGKGKRSSDGTTLTWEYAYNCPINKRPTTMREVETRTGPDSMTLEMFGKDPKSGKEFKMMEIAMERTSRDGARASAAPGMFSDKKAEAGCGLCSYHMEGARSCVLAVKIDGKPYLVSQGANLVNVHQFCGAKGAKPAVVTGKIVDGKFEAKEIELSSATR